MAKKHSLTREAVAVGKAAGCYRTLLTHFSQRYPKIPVLDASYRSCTVRRAPEGGGRLQGAQGLRSARVRPPPLRAGDCV